MAAKYWLVNFFSFSISNSKLHLIQVVQNPYPQSDALAEDQCLTETMTLAIFKS